MWSFGEFWQPPDVFLAVICAGAVYSPFWSMLPTLPGVSDQVTGVGAVYWMFPPSVIVGVTPEVISTLIALASPPPDNARMLGEPN